MSATESLFLKAFFVNSYNFLGDYRPIKVVLGVSLAGTIRWEFSKCAEACCQAIGDLSWRGALKDQIF